ncbi:MAG: Xaa-Pro peptidase family protein [Ruminococcus sp.]|jgi:Xaa-Pro aminopeptidase|nr:Xaa-Pro peptidase family protein [Ruminococcus sp.]
MLNNLRIEKLIKNLPENVNCALITSNINRKYFTGMKSSAGVLAVFRDGAYLFIDFRYIEKARKMVKSAEVIEITRYYEQLKDLLKSHKAETVAVESREMTLFALSTYKERLPKVKFLSDNTLSDLITDMRQVKDAEEITKIELAQEIAEDAFHRILKFIKVGMSERQIALELDNLMLESGSEGVSFDTIVLTGANTSMPHGVPNKDSFAEKNDLILMDFGAVVDGYHSDMTRTICLGNMTEEQKFIYSLVLETQKTALKAVKSGVKGKIPDKIARDFMGEYNVNFRHSLGHGVGLEIHEEPNLSENSDSVLSPGNIVTVEPGIYLPGKFGVRIEDFVAVTEYGCRNLTKAPK